jgi:DNA transposition AAA+ family ATPase
MNNENDQEPTISRHDHVRCQRLPGDAVMANTESLPENQRKAIRWLHAYGDEQNLTNKALGERIGYSESTIGRIFSDNYEGNLDKVCEAIATLRGEVDAVRNNGKKDLPFIETTLSKHIFDIADLALKYRRIAYAFGETQIGKSRSIKELAAQHKGEYGLWEMPVGGALTNFMTNGAKALRITARGDRSILRRRLIENRCPLIIIDQMHRCFADAQGNMLDEVSATQMATLDFIIEMFDHAEPGFFLIGSNVFRDGISQAVHKNFFRQLRGRSLNPEGFQLPDLPSEDDLNAFARHYRLQPATGAALKVQTDIIQKYGLAVWLTRLQFGHARAVKSNRAMVWDDVVRAHDTFTKIGRAHVSTAPAIVPKAAAQAPKQEAA